MFSYELRNNDNESTGYIAVQLGSSGIRTAQLGAGIGSRTDFRLDVWRFGLAQVPGGGAEVFSDPLLPDLDYTQDLISTQ